MRHVVFNEHLSKAVSRGQRIHVAVVVVRTYFGDHRDLAAGVDAFALPVATFDDGEPQTQMDFSTPRESCTTVGGRDGWNGNVHRAHSINGVGTVHADPGIDVLVVVQHICTVPWFGVCVVGGLWNVVGRVFTETTGQHAGREEQHHQHGLEVHENTGAGGCIESIGQRRFTHRCRWLQLRLPERPFRLEPRPCRGF